MANALSHISLSKQSDQLKLLSNHSQLRICSDKSNGNVHSTVSCYAPARTSIDTCSSPSHSQYCACNPAGNHGNTQRIVRIRGTPQQCPRDASAQQASRSAHCSTEHPSYRVIVPTSRHRSGNPEHPTPAICPGTFANGRDHASAGPTTTGTTNSVQWANHRPGNTTTGRHARGHNDTAACTNLDTFIARQGAGPLPSFDGTPAEWPVFIQIYESSTNTCNYTDAESLACLQNSLKGNAKTLVQSLLALPVNVPTIIETLKLHYGRSDLIIETLIDQVQALPSVDELHLSDFAVAVQNLVTTIVSAHVEAHLQNPQLRKDLMGRLPPSLRLQWGEKVADIGPNHVNLPHFSKWLTAKANALSFVVQPQPKQTPALATATALVAVAPPRKPTSRTHRTRPLTCVYCDKPGHYPDECKRYAMVADRKEQLNKKRRCYLCLSRRHTQAECDSARKCAHCQMTGRPHCSLCPTKFAQPGTSTTQKPSGIHHAEAAAQPSTCTERPTHTEPATLTVGREAVRMQTATTQVVNPRHPDSPVTARILFDSGSYRTYITQTLADKLQLRQSNPEMLHLATFGNDAVQHISARSADLAVHLADDTMQQVTATVIPTITGNITTAPLSSDVRASLPADIQLQLADGDTVTVTYL